MTVPRLFPLTASIGKENRGVAMSMHKFLSRMALSGFLAVFAELALAEPGASANALVLKPFDIAAQPAATALNEFARQADITLVFSYELVAPMKTSPIKGSYSITDALARLLEGTALSYQQLNSTTVAIAEKGKPLAGRAAVSEKLRIANDDTGAAKAQEGAEKEDVNLEEVVVTAQKRKERLQEVPISITVLSGADLDTFTGASVNQALAAAPGITVNQGGILSNATVLNIRGVSAASATFGGSSPVAYYVDSVPFGLQRQAIVPDPNAYDMERVEVLRGPQGTLYGANALNGVVRVLTHDADLTKFELKTRASVSAIDQGGESYRADLAANLPIVEGKLAARVVLGYDDEGGWIDRSNKSDINSGHVSNARLKLNAQPMDNLSLGLSAWISRSQYDASTVSDEHYRYDGVLEQPQSGDFNAFGFKAGYELPAFSVSSMTSYVDYTSEDLLDATPLVAAFGFPLFLGTSYSTALHSKVLAEEILLASTRKGPWRWSLGGFYRDAKDQTDQHGIFVPAPVAYNDLSKSNAVFGELTRLFLDGKLELTGGLRYFQDRVTLKELVPDTGVAGDPLAFDRKTFDDVSPRVVLTWHPAHELTVYGSYSKGFRSGIDQSPTVVKVAPAYPAAKPDSLRNYELGAKGNSPSGRLSYDVALYFMDWKDVQQNVGVQIGAGNYAAFVNGVSASGPGFDLAMSSRLVGGLELSGSFSWNDLGFDRPTLNPGTGTVLLGKGDRLALSSEYTVRAGLDYVFPLGAGGLEGKFSTGVNWQSKQSTRVVNAGPTTLEGDDILISRASFSISSADRWQALLFVDNLNNEQRLIQVSNPVASSWSTYTRPRTVGLQFEYRFSGPH